MKFRSLLCATVLASMLVASGLAVANPDLGRYVQRSAAYAQGVEPSATDAVAILRSTGPSDVAGLAPSPFAPPLSLPHVPREVTQVEFDEFFQSMPPTYAGAFDTGGYGLEYAFAEVNKVVTSKPAAAGDRLYGGVAYQGVMAVLDLGGFAVDDGRTLYDERVDPVWQEHVAPLVAQIP